MVHGIGFERVNFRIITVGRSNPIGLITFQGWCYLSLPVNKVLDMLVWDHRTGMFSKIPSKPLKMSVIVSDDL